VTTLDQLLHRHFPAAMFEDASQLRVESFPEWTSMAHFNFLLAVEEHYGIRFSVDEMTEMKSIADIRNKLASEGIAA
jgi:acyl carrier protein